MTGVIKLDTAGRKELHQCLVEAFDVDELRLVVGLNLDEKLDYAIDYKQAKTGVALDLVRKASQLDMVRELVTAVYHENSTNHRLATFAYQYNIEPKAGDVDTWQVVLELVEARGDWEEIERLKGVIKELQLAQNETRTDRLKPIRSAHETLFVTNYPYGLENHFVGRKDEMSLLNAWFHDKVDKPLMGVIGLGGTGKSALTWKWINDLMENQLAPPLVVWWSFYEADGTLEVMLRRILEESGIDTESLRSLRQLYDKFMTLSQQKPMLIMLDGAERLLRAYGSMGAAYQGDGEEIESGDRDRGRACVDPVGDLVLGWLAESRVKVKTVLTSRLFPQALQGRTGDKLAGVERHDLTGIGLDDAVTLFTRKGIEATRADVEAVCAPLAYHPLSLRLLANWLAHDPLTRRDIRDAVAYDVNADLLGKREHVLAQVYAALTDGQQRLLGQMAALRSAIDAQLLKDAFNPAPDDVNALLKWGVVQRSIVAGTWQYDLHPIVRRYAYSRLTNPTNTHKQLVTVFWAVPQPEQIVTLADLRPAIEFYHHLAHAERYHEAREIFRDRLCVPLYSQLGAYQTCIELLRVLFVDGEDTLPRLPGERAQAWTSNELAKAYTLIGQPQSAIPLFKTTIQIDEKRNDKGNLATGLRNLAHMAETHIGWLQSADSKLRQSIALCREFKNHRRNEAIGHRELGYVLLLSGAWDEAETELTTAFEQFGEENAIQSQYVVWRHRAEAGLLRGRPEDIAMAHDVAQQALHFAQERAKIGHPKIYGFVYCYWLLGWSAAAVGAWDEAERELDEALRRCRAINLVELESKILLAQARLALWRDDAPPPRRDTIYRVPTGRGDAVALLDEAEQIAERCGYVLDLADIYNERAQIEMERGDREKAREYAEVAKGYAWCDGRPFAYESALSRAEKLLEQL